MDKIKKILFSSLHHIDISKDKVIEVHLENPTSDLGAYINSTIEQITAKREKRGFQIAKGTNIDKAISSYVSEDFESSNTLPNRLLEVETQRQSELGNFTKLLKGSLFQFVIEYGGFKRVFVLKADHKSFLDEKELVKRLGLPLEDNRKIYKAFVARIEDTNDVSKVYVYDTNEKISEYWWKDFLELKEEKDNYFNTDRAYGALLKKVINPIKRKSKADFNQLKNSHVSYFNRNNAFRIDKYVDEVLGEYVPISKQVDIEKVKKNMVDAPKDDRFDSSFDIDQTAVDLQQKRSIINLRDNVDLVIKGEVEEFNNVIIPEIGDDNKKYLRIQTDKGYDEFGALKNE